MRYHAKTIDLVSKPVPAGNEQSVILAERRLGIRLPESVREWYSEIDGQNLLSKYSNDEVKMVDGVETRVVEERETRDGKLVEPGIKEYKYYAAGVGLVQDGSLKLVK